MFEHTDEIDILATRVPWNKGKLTGQKPPLQPRHVWAIRTQLQLTGRVRDLAPFNLAIDSKLRGCDVVALRVEDVAPHGYALDRATVRQKKTGRPVKFEMTDHTRAAIDDHLRAKARKPGDYLFAGAAILVAIFQRVNMPVWSATGLPWRVSIRFNSERIRCVEQKPH